MRGEGAFDPFVATIPDEYFFIVLSMVVTGAAAVWRWDALFLDRRDYSNIVPLPISLRRVFLGNLCAILLLAVVLTLDVNAASFILFPVASGRLTRLPFTPNQIRSWPCRHGSSRQCFQFLRCVRHNRPAHGAAAVRALSQNFLVCAFSDRALSPRSACYQLCSYFFPRPSRTHQQARGQFPASRLVSGAGPNLLGQRRNPFFAVMTRTASVRSRMSLVSQFSLTLLVFDAPSSAFQKPLKSALSRARNCISFPLDFLTALSSAIRSNAPASTSSLAHCFAAKLTCRSRRHLSQWG